MPVTIGRRELIAVLSSTAAWPIAARAQQPLTKLRRIGWISGSTRPPSIEASNFGGFLEGMRALGYVEGRDFSVEWRFTEAKNERFSEFAAELVGQNVDVIVTSTSAAVGPVQKATATIPIIMSYSTDPVGNGFVASLARPGGNLHVRPERLGKAVDSRKEGPLIDVHFIEGCQRV